jgi:PAS domain S-box-containing protein
MPSSTTSSDDESSGSTERLTGIVESAMDAIVAIDDAQHIVVFNPAAERMFRCAAADAIGTPIERFIPPRFHAAGGLWALRADGEEFPIEVSFSRAHVGGRPVFTAILRDVTERRRAEETQLLLSAIVQSSNDAIISVDLNGIILSWNAAAERIFGWREAEARGQSIKTLVSPELRDEQQRVFERVKGGEQISHYETVRVTKGGKPIDVSMTASPLRDVAGRLVGVSCVVCDVTDARRIDATVRESEERFRIMADGAPMMLWMSGPDKTCNYVNRGFLEFTGRSMEAELGDGWTDGLHPQDLERSVDTYVNAFDRREPFSMEYRLRRHDGEYRWVLVHGAPRVAPDGSFAGYIGSAIDVTRHKLAEEALSSLNHRLLQALEDERRSIARELHDDFAQRMTLMAIELDALGQALGNRVELRDRVHALYGRAVALGSDLQTVSHHLHSSKLEYVGLPVAAAGFCRELSVQHGVTVDFEHEEVPADLPKPIALGVFRVLQEGLTNAVKHANVRHFTVALHGGPGAIHLEVVDDGIGFDLEAAIRRRGLGLLSMQERVNLIKGKMSIETQPGHGTTVRVHVPINS